MRLVVAVLTAVTFASPAAAQDALVATSSAGHIATVTSAGITVAGPDGRFAPPERIFPSALAVGARGDAVAVYGAPGESRGLLAAYRPAGGSFEAPVLLDAQGSGGGESSPAAGVDARGTAVVAWVSGGDQSLVTRVRDPAGGWLVEQRLGGQDVFRPRLVVVDSGIATLAWRQNIRRNVGELAVATRAPESSGFGRPEIVTPKDDHPGDGPALAANDRGDAVVAWDAGGVGAASFMRGSFRAGLGAFGPARRLTPGAGHFPSVAVRADGGMVIAWARNGRTASTRLRTPTGSLQRPYTLTRNHEENTTVIALARGHGAVAWLHREPPRSMLRVASFGGDGRVGRPKTILRIRESWDLPDPLAFLDVPRGLYFVRGPSRDAARPLRLIRVS